MSFKLEEENPTSPKSPVILTDPKFGAMWTFTFNDRWSRLGRFLTWLGIKHKIGQPKLKIIEFPEKRI